MISAFVERHKRSFMGYGIALRLAGWAVLAILVIYGPGMIRSMLGILEGDAGSTGLQIVSHSVFAIAGMFTFGLILLGLAQLIRFISQPVAKCGWILRHGHILLDIYALMLVAQTFLSMTMLIPSHIQYTGLIIFITSVAKCLVIMGMGLVLKYVLPMIEESKATV